MAKQNVTVFDLLHDVDSQYKQGALAACKSSYTTHLKVNLSDSEVIETPNEEEQESPAKVTGVTEDRALVRIGDTCKKLFCEGDLLIQLEDLVPVKGTATFKGERLLAFQPEDV